MKRDFDPQNPELMDRPQPVSRELEVDLENLESLNRYFGGHRLLLRFLEGWLSPGRCYRVLDLCTGSGDYCRLMVDWARARDIVLRLDAVDANAATLEIARRRSAEYPEIRFVQADALRYEPDERYDLVCCMLALHHFGDDDAALLLRRCREHSTRYTLVADLERSVATTVGVRMLTTFLYREPMTRHDAIVSARRAFSFAEFRALADRADWRDFGHARYLFCRQALWLDEREVAAVPDLEIETMPSPA